MASHGGRDKGEPPTRPRGDSYRPPNPTSTRESSQRNNDRQHQPPKAQADIEKQLLEFANSVAAQTLNHVKLAQATEAVEAKQDERDKGRGLHIGNHFSPWTENLEAEVHAATQELDALKKTDAEHSGKIKGYARAIARAFEDAKDPHANRRIEELAREVENLKNGERIGQVDAKLSSLEATQKEFSTLTNEVKTLKQDQITSKSRDFVALKGRLLTLETGVKYIEENDLPSIRQSLEKTTEYQEFLEGKVQVLIAFKDEHVTQDTSAREPSSGVTERLAKLETVVHEATKRVNEVTEDLHGKGEEDGAMKWIVHLFDELRDDGPLKGSLNNLTTQMEGLSNQLKANEKKLSNFEGILYPDESSKTLLDMCNEQQEMSQGIGDAMFDDFSKVSHRLQQLEVSKSVRQSPRPTSTEEHQTDLSRIRATLDQFTTKVDALSNIQATVEDLKKNTQGHAQAISNFQTTWRAIWERITGCTETINQLQARSMPESHQLQNMRHTTEAARNGVAILQKRFDNLTTNHVVEAVLERLKRYYPLEALNEVKNNLRSLTTATNEIRKEHGSRLEALATSNHNLEESRSPKNAGEHPEKAQERYDELSQKIAAVKTQVDEKIQLVDARNQSQEKLENKLNDFDARLEEFEGKSDKENANIFKQLASLERSVKKVQETKDTLDTLQRHMEDKIPAMKADLQKDIEVATKKIDELTAEMADVAQMSNQHEQSIAEYEKRLGEKANIDQLEESVTALREEASSIRRKQSDDTTTAMTSKPAPTASSSKSTPTGATPRPSFKQPLSSPATRSKNTKGPESSTKATPSNLQRIPSLEDRMKYSDKDKHPESAVSTIGGSRNPTPSSNHVSMKAIKRQREDSTSPPNKNLGKPSYKKNKLEKGNNLKKTTSKPLKNESTDPIILDDDDDDDD